MRDLGEIREDIDRIDEQIVSLYEKRMELTSGVAEYKIRTGKQIFDREREESKLSALSSLVSSGEKENELRTVSKSCLSRSWR